MKTNYRDFNDVLLQQLHIGELCRVANSQKQFLSKNSKKQFDKQGQLRHLTKIFLRIYYVWVK